MPEIETICPYPWCGKKTTAWVGFLQHKTEHDADRACPKHREKYRKLLEEWRKFEMRSDTSPY
jgi:hypothetical protein